MKIPEPLQLACILLIAHHRYCIKEHALRGTPHYSPHAAGLVEGARIVCQNIIRFSTDRNKPLRLAVGNYMREQLELPMANRGES